MEQHHGYFCRAYIGQDVQANVIARTLREAEQEITRVQEQDRAASALLIDERPAPGQASLAGVHRTTLARPDVTFVIRGEQEIGCGLRERGM